MNKNKLFYLLVAGLIVIPATPAFAEDVSTDPVVEQPVSEPAPEPAQSPAPETNDEPGTWSVVDSSGNVVNAIICQQSVCGEGGALSGEGMLCDGCTVHFQQPGQAGWHTSGDLEVSYDRENGNHSITESGTNDTGHTSSNTFTMKDGIILNQSQTHNFSYGQENAVVDTYSIRQLSDQNIDELIEESVKVQFSTGQELNYFNSKDLVASIESDVESFLAQEQEQSGNAVVEIAVSVAESIRNIASQIVTFFSDLIN